MPAFTKIQTQDPWFESQVCYHSATALPIRQLLMLLISGTLACATIRFLKQKSKFLASTSKAGAKDHALLQK